MQNTFYFGYMAMVCLGFFLMLGYVGFRASLMFVRRIYRVSACGAARACMEGPGGPTGARDIHTDLPMCLMRAVPALPLGRKTGSQPTGATAVVLMGCMQVSSADRPRPPVLDCLQAIKCE